MQTIEKFHTIEEIHAALEKWKRLKFQFDVLVYDIWYEKDKLVAVNNDDRANRDRFVIDLEKLYLHTPVNRHGQFKCWSIGYDKMPGFYNNGAITSRSQSTKRH